MISARAVAVYLYLLTSRSSASGERLSKVFKEGRVAMEAALKELREIGLLVTNKKRIGNRIVTISDVVEPDLWAPETCVLLQQCKPNSQLAYTPYSLITYCFNSFANSRTEVRQKEKEETRVLEVSMGGWDNLFSSENSIDREEYLRESKKAARKKQEDYEASKSKAFEKHNLYRGDLPVSEWKPKHICQEFSNRIWTMHIKPWNVNASDFIKAMGNTRKKYGTDGETELRVMDLFFVRIDLSKYSEPEHLWRLFLKMFPMLLSTVRLNQVASKSIQDSLEEEDDKYWIEKGL